MRTATAAAALLLLGACAGTEAPAPTTTGSGTDLADRSCLRDVAATTGNRDVRVVGTTASPTETVVIVGVGPTGQWRCTAYPDGTTSGIQSLTDEGGL